MITLFFQKNNVENIIKELEEKFTQEPSAENDAKIFALATKAYELAPEDGQVIYILAQCYDLAIGVAENIDKALELYEKLTKNNAFDCDADFQYKLAKVYEKKGNDNCILWYYRASVNGDQWSTYYVGSLLLEGNLMNDIPYQSKYQLAMKFLNKAANMTDDIEIANLAKDKINLNTVENKIRLLEIEKQQKIMSVINI